jgi:hypothetical protein
LQILENLPKKSTIQVTKAEIWSQTIVIKAKKRILQAKKIGKEKVILKWNNQIILAR